MTRRNDALIDAAMHTARRPVTTLLLAALFTGEAHAASETSLQAQWLLDHLRALPRTADAVLLRTVSGGVEPAADGLWSYHVRRRNTALHLADPVRIATGQGEPLSLRRRRMR